MTITVFHIPVHSEVDAASLAKLALENRLAACANVYPVQSHYPWKDAIAHSHEWVVFLKTIPALTAALREMVEENHSYEIPAILSWEVEVNQSYGTWMNECLQQ